MLIIYHAYYAHLRPKLAAECPPQLCSVARVHHWDASNTALAQYLQNIVVRPISN